MYGIFLVSGVIMLMSVVLAIVSAGSRSLLRNGPHRRKAGDRAAGAQHPVAEEAAPEAPSSGTASASARVSSGLESLQSELRELLPLRSELRELRDVLQQRQALRDVLPQQAQRAPKQAGESTHDVPAGSPRYALAFALTDGTFNTPRNPPAVWLSSLRSKQDDPAAQSAGTVNGRVDPTQRDAPCKLQPAPFTTNAQRQQDCLRPPQAASGQQAWF
jgi:hypothetical protein